MFVALLLLKYMRILKSK